MVNGRLKIQLHGQCRHGSIKADPGSAPFPANAVQGISAIHALTVSVQRLPHEMVLLKMQVANRKVRVWPTAPDRSRPEPVPGPDSPCHRSRLWRNWFLQDPAEPGAGHQPPGQAITNSPLDNSIKQATLWCSNRASGGSAGQRSATLGGFPGEHPQLAAGTEGSGHAQQRQRARHRSGEPADGGGGGAELSVEG